MTVYAIYFLLSQKIHNFVGCVGFLLKIQVSQIILQKNLSIPWEVLFPRKQTNNWLLRSCSILSRETDSPLISLFLIFFHIILALHDYISIPRCIVNVVVYPLKPQTIFGLWNYGLYRKRENLYFFPSL